MDNGSISIKKASDIDSDRWDEYVLSNPNSSPYHLYAWRKAVEDAYSHKCTYLYAESGNKIIGALPMVHIHLPGIVNEMISLPFCDVGNCISDSDEIQDMLCSEAIRYKEAHKAKTAQIRGDLAATEATQLEFEDKAIGKVRMLLDLPVSSDQLFKNFKSKLRSQIRKAEKNGVSFFWGSEENIGNAYNVFAKNMHELGSPVHSRAFLRSVLMHYGSRAKLGLAEFQGTIVGMGIILLGGNGVSVPWASTLREYNRLGPNMLLYWNFLKFSADQGFSFFDFGRSTEGEGTYKFKKQWGAKPIPLIWHETIKAKKKSQASKHNEPANRSRSAEIWKKMPRKVVNIIGPCIRRYINL